MRTALEGMVKLVLFIQTFLQIGNAKWSDWWTYEGISGPVYWGTLNSDWSLCSKGKFQSPINIAPSELLFDPGLRQLAISGNKVAGVVENKGNDVTFFVNSSIENSVNISLGPLSYIYTVYQIKLHFGGSNGYGTEHKFNGKQFDAEIQIMAYNSDVYANYKTAEKSPKGLAILALFAKVKGNFINRELNKITSNVDYIQYRDDTFKINEFFIQRLIPDNKDYITYEGSLTQPACHETVTWILLNKPVYIGEFQINSLRTLRQDGPGNPQAYMYNNMRTIQNTFHRPLRTNINLNNRCAMKRSINYKAAMSHVIQRPFPSRHRQ